MNTQAALSIIVAATMAAAGVAYGASKAVLASNGVQVDIDADEFQPSQDYSAPIIKDGRALYLYAVRRTRDRSLFLVEGAIDYRGDWRNYDRAFMKGGDPVKFDVMQHKVLGCFSRQCDLREEFMLTLTDAQIAKAEQEGELLIQVGSQGGDEFLLKVPEAHIKAVGEVFKRPAAP